MPLILIAEDEAPIATLLKYNLEKEGFTVITAVDGEHALRLVHSEHPDVVLLDWMMPVLSGVDVCRRLRGDAKTRSLPILMITARGEESDRIKGLDTGADDYITKPFSPAEVIARIKAVLRRAQPDREGSIIKRGDIEMDIASHKVRRNNQEIHLGPTEYRLLRYFMENPSKVFSREHLLDAIWGNDVYVEVRTVDVHIRRLRKALNDAGHDPIRTVRSAGYGLEA
jgi:two-component system phosphate regulon response regulator PhoB